MEFTEQQIQRYSRHIILNEVGGKGQVKLSKAKVLLIGAGGLGSPAALYLAASGIGTIGLVDGDVVDLSNLQRQILHTTATIGTPKVESGQKMLSAINPDITIKTYQLNVDSENILGLRALQRHDICDAIEVSDCLVGAGEQSAALKGDRLPRMVDDLIEDVLRDREVGHVRRRRRRCNPRPSP